MLAKRAWLAGLVLFLSFGVISADARTGASRRGIVVFSRADANGRYSLFTVSPSTRQVRQVTHSCGWDWFPAWSPDGRRIAFAGGCGRSLNLEIVDASGKNLRQVVDLSTTNQSMDEVWPTWSPDGTKIAFVSAPTSTVPGQADTDSELWVVGADGSGLKQLTHDGVPEDSPAWSPNGKRIAYSTLRKGHGRIWVVSADGQRAHSLGLTGGEPAWSPDGSWLAFAHGTGETVNLFVAKADGKGVRRLTHAQTGVVLHHPSWSPDGRSIVYIGAKGLQTISVNGRGARSLTRTSTEDVDPDWWKPAALNASG